MKLSSLTIVCMLQALAFEVSLFSTTFTMTSAMKMTNMLMGQPLETFLSDLVSFDEMSNQQKQSILRMADGDVSADGHRINAFATDESKESLRSYLHAQVSEGDLEVETAEVIASTLSLGGLYPTAGAENALAAMLLDGPAQAVYNTAGEGNMVRLGTSRTLVPVTNNDNYIHNGIWGYATGQREYALQCHGAGLAIIDVTDPSATFRVQLIPMSGGGIWRDVATHLDAASGKTFAYVGAQGTQSGNLPNLFVVDLSYLSGDINLPNGENSDPIPPAGYDDLGYTGLTHTINIARGLLFLNRASGSNGCLVFDLTVDPWNPTLLFQTGISSSHACHDSYVGEDINGKDVLFVSDGGGRKERFYDITNVDSSWTIGQVPPQIGTGTQGFSGIYAHSGWLSEDKRYFFAFEEFNVADIFVHDVTDLENPVWITRFQYSQQGGANSNAIVHNGEIRGNYLYVAYYEAGLRVFDISNPYLPVEVGKVETHRDPNGDGNYEFGISNSYLGAWNTYPYLPSGNILVNDIDQGLYIARADPPYDAPAGPSNVVATRDTSNNVSLDWDAVQDVRGYSVERSLDGGATYSVVAEHMVGTSYVDLSVVPIAAQYRINAINCEGVGTSAVVTTSTNAPSKSPTTAPVAPSKSPTNTPTTSPTLPGMCSNDQSVRCSTADDCACSGVLPSSSTLFDRRGRELQDLCAGKNRGQCNGECAWISRSCVSIASQAPTSKPTSSPSKSPTPQPTNNPIQCQCLMTAYPTRSPTRVPTSLPTQPPTPGAVCLVKGATCPADRSKCCTGQCETKGRNLKCT